MIKQPIPLSMAIPDKEYIINNVPCKADISKTLEGYGIFPDSKIKLLFSSPSGDPSAYEVMGAVLALRRENAKNIFIIPI